MTDFRALCAELLEALENAIRVIYHEDGTKHISTADPVIAKADAALAQPEPQGPTDEEAQKLFEATRVPIYAAPSLGMAEQIVGYEPVKPGRFARAVLARWGRPAIEPVPVAERLPGPDDCDAEDQCWLWRTDGTEEFWELVIPPNKIHEYNLTSQCKYTHWLPHHSLPVPQSEVV